MTWLLLCVAGCSEPPPPRLPAPRPDVVPRAAPDAPNVVIVTLDTTRADALGVYGGPEGVSPSFDAWAARGVRFDMALSHIPTTLASHGSIFTGLDPHGHRVPRNGFALQPGVETLAERLSAAGYDTIGVVGASVVGREMGMAQGFRLFDDDLQHDMIRRYEDTGDRVTDRALALLARRERDKPLMLWVHYYDAHSPYIATPELLARYTEPGYQPAWARDDQLVRLGHAIREGRPLERDVRYLRGMYEAEVAFADMQWGRLFEGLEAGGVLDHAVVVLTADHGEMFAERHDHPLGHGPCVDTFVTRVPLVIAGTGEAALEPAVVEQAVKLSDIPSTVLDLAGVGGPMGTGQDLVPLLRGGELAADPIFLEASKPRQAEDREHWNNLYKEHGVAMDGYLLRVRGDRLRSGRLFRLAPGQPEAADPAERRKLSLYLEGWLDASPPYRPEHMSADAREALRALGYVE